MYLVETIRDCKDEFLTFHFADNFSEMLVFDRKELAKITQVILEDSGIPATRRGSADMLRVWNASSSGRQVPDRKRRREE
jgi:hypothetical protein